MAETRKPDRKTMIGCGVLLAVFAIAGGIFLGWATSPASVTFRPLGNDIYAAIILPGTPADQVDRAAHAHCAGKQSCFVRGWVDADKAATAIEMTDRETAAQIYDLKINRSTGYDRSLFACSVFASAPKDRCWEPPSEAELENAL